MVCLQQHPPHYTFHLFFHLNNHKLPKAHNNMSPKSCGSCGKTFSERDNRIKCDLFGCDVWVCFDHVTTTRCSFCGYNDFVYYCETHKTEAACNGSSLAVPCNKRRCSSCWKTCGICKNSVCPYHLPPFNPTCYKCAQKSSSTSSSSSSSPSSSSFSSSSSSAPYAEHAQLPSQNYDLNQIRDTKNWSDEEKKRVADLVTSVTCKAKGISADIPRLHISSNVYYYLELRSKYHSDEKLYEYALEEAIVDERIVFDEPFPVRVRVLPCDHLLALSVTKSYCVLIMPHPKDENLPCLYLSELDWASMITSMFNVLFVVFEVKCCKVK